MPRALPTLTVALPIALDGAELNCVLSTTVQESATTGLEGAISLSGPY